MADEEDKNVVDGEKREITVTAESIDGIVETIGMEPVDPEELETEPPEYPEELMPVLETLVDIYGGVERATEEDSRGRSRKMVRQYADREDVESNDVGHLLRVLEIHDLVVQDGNRWRIAAEEE